MINIQNITKKFKSTEALKDISFDISKGEIVGILGENGAGKTTLMRLLTTYLTPTKGNIFIENKDIHKAPITAKRKIGYLPENPPLYPNMRVFEYLKFVAKIKDIPIRQVPAQVDRVLNQCHILDVSRKFIHSLSKGYKQRVGIAQTIISEPEILILDEPMSGLDPIQITQVRKLIKNLEYKRTVILSTHILSEIEKIVKRIIIMKDGEIICDSPINKINHLTSDQEELKEKIIIKARGPKPLINEAIKNSHNVKKLQLNIDNNQICSIELIKTKPIEHYNEVINNLLKVNAEIIEIKTEPINLENTFLKIIESHQDTTNE